MCALRSWVLVMLVAVVAASKGVAQLPPPPKDSTKQVKQPRLFVGQRKVDLGKVLEGDRVPLKWTLENQGSADLVITETRASCGCTVLRLSDEQKVIPPGGKLEIHADFDSHRRFGNQTKLVTVESNDPAEPRLQLEFTAEVERVYDLSPTILNLRSVRRGIPSERVITITPEGGRKQVEVVDITYQQPASLTYVAEPIKTQAGTTGQKVTFTVTEDAALGSVIADAVIRLKVDGLERTAELPIRGEVVAELNWSPKVVDATRQASPRGQQLQSVRISSSEARPFEITRAAAGPLLDVAFTRAAGSEPKYDVQLTIREDAPAGPFAASLEVHTNLVDQPVVAVPVFGIVAPLIEVEPPMILLVQDGTPAGTKRRVRLQSPPQVPLNVRSAVSQTEAVSVNLETRGRLQHLLFLNVQVSGQLPKGNHESKIVLETTITGAERVEIPMTIVVPG